MTMRRRRFLEAASAAVTGAGALAAATDRVTAQSFVGPPTGLSAPPPDYPVLDLRQSDPPTSGDYPTGADEILFFVHGWLAARPTVIDGTPTTVGEAAGYTLEEALRDNGYGHPTVTALWPSFDLDWYDVQSTADTAGSRFATWLNDYMLQYPDTTVRVVGHSLGTRVTLEALTAVVPNLAPASVALLGGAVDPGSVCDSGVYHDAVATAGEVHNYHSRNDTTVGNVYQIAELTTGIGHDGSTCGAFLETPENYTDVDVTATVTDHTDYHKPSVGIVPRLVANFSGT